MSLESPAPDAEYGLPTPLRRFMVLIISCDDEQTFGGNRMSHVDGCHSVGPLVTSPLLADVPPCLLHCEALAKMCLPKLSTTAGERRQQQRT